MENNIPRRISGVLLHNDMNTLSYVFIEDLDT